MTERELERLQAEREPDELVAEADPEERHLSEQLAHGLDRPVELSRVAGAVADQHRRRVELEHGLGVPGAGDDNRLDARLDEPPHDRALAAEVEHDDARTCADRERLGHAGVERGWGRGELGLCEHARPVEVRLGERVGVQLLRRRCAERAAHGAVLAEAADERTRVDLLQRDDAPLREPVGPVGTRAPHHDALGPDAARLEQRLVDAVVADEGRREREHLARVARVGDGLLVAGRGRREAGFAGCDPGRADGASGEDGAVLEHELGVHEMHSNHNLCIIRSMSVATTILGASGYSGQETLDRVLAHPELELVALGSDSLAGSARERARPAAERLAAGVRHQRRGARGPARSSSSAASSTSARRRSNRRPTQSSSTSRARTGSTTPRSIRSGTASSIRRPARSAPGATRSRSSSRRRAADRQPGLLRDRRPARARAAAWTRSSPSASSSTRSRASPARGGRSRPRRMRPRCSRTSRPTRSARTSTPPRSRRRSASPSASSHICCR